MIRKKYQTIYDEMRQRNLKNIQNSGLTFDPIISQPVVDVRRSLSVFGFFESSSQSLDKITSEAAEIFPDQIIYRVSPISIQSGLLHVTLIQYLKTGAANKGGAHDDLRKYVLIFEKALKDIPPFEVSYEGLIALPGNIVLFGYPSIDINNLRENIRDQVAKEKVRFEEPYKSDTVHSSFVRFSAPEDSHKAIEFAKKYENIKLGKFKFNKFVLGYGTWRMNPKETEMLYEFDLESKQIVQL